MGRKPGEARPYRLRDIREHADRLAQLRAWHLFISYARKPDDVVAPQLRRYVMRVARPWWGFSNLRVFLDKDAMAPASELKGQIAGILSSSSSMVLLASPASAESAWVRKEVSQWLAERGERPLIVVHTGGTLNFHRPEDRDGGVDLSTTTALDRETFQGDATAAGGRHPRTFWITDLRSAAERLATERGDGESRAATRARTSRAGLPRLGRAAGDIWAGMRLRRDEREAFRRTALAVVAGVLDMDRDRLSSFERRRRRIFFAVLATVVVLFGALSTATVIGQVQRQRADQIALSRKLAADSAAHAGSDPDVAALLAAQAYRTAPTAEASSAVVSAASRPLLRVLRGHVAAVTSVAAAGTIAITASGDGTARVWDTRTGAASTVLEPDCGAIRQVAVSPDARLLLTVCSTVVRSWDLATGAPLRSFTSQGATFGKVAYSSERQVVVVEGEQGVAWLWDPHSGQELQSLPGHARRVTAAAFTVDGRLLATGDEAGKVRLWDTSTGALQGVLIAGANEEVTESSLTFGFVTELAFMHDAKTLAVAVNDRAASLWDVSDRRRVHVLSGPLNGTSSVTVSPDDRIVATAGMDGSVRTWDPTTGSQLHVMTPGGLGTWSVRFSHDGHHLLSVSEDHTADLWDVQSGTSAGTLVGHTGAVRAGAYCADDSCVITASTDGTARLWTTVNVSGRHTYDTQQKNLRALVNEPEGALFGTISSPGSALLLDPRDPAGGVRSLDVGPGGQGIDISPDGRTVATGGDDHLLRLWDLASGRQLSALAGHTAPISGVYFSPDGALIATTSYDKTVRLWDSQTGALRHVLHGEWENPWALAFAPAGDLLATSYNDDHIQIWDTRSGSLVAQIISPFPVPNHSTGVETLAFSPDGALLASGGQNHAVCLWDPRTGTLVRALQDATDDISQVEFSPDGTRIAAAGSEQVARVWDVGTGTQLFVLGGYSDELTGLNYSRDGRLVAVGGYDGTLRFWDAHTGQLLKTVRMDLGFHLVLFSPDSTTLITASFDGKIRTWDRPPEPDDAVHAICHAVGRNLTDAEWSRFAPGRPAPKTCP